MAGIFMNRMQGVQESSGGSGEEPWQGAADSHSRLGAVGGSHWGNARARRVLNLACEAVCRGSGVASLRVQWWRTCKHFLVETRIENSIPALLVLAWWPNYCVTIELLFACAFRPNYSVFPCCMGIHVPSASENTCPRTFPQDLHSPDQTVWLSLESSQSNRVSKSCYSACSYIKCKQQCATVP